MSTQDNQPKKIDFLQLTDAEKADLIREAKKNLRDQLEEAKLWRTRRKRPNNNQRIGS